MEELREVLVDGVEEELVKGKGRRRLMIFGVKGKRKREDLGLDHVEAWVRISGGDGLDGCGALGTSMGLSTSWLSSGSGSSSGVSSYCARGSGRGAKWMRRVPKSDLVVDVDGEVMTALGAVRAVMDVGGERS